MRKTVETSPTIKLKNLVTGKRPTKDVIEVDTSKYENMELTEIFDLPADEFNDLPLTFIHRLANKEQFKALVAGKDYVYPL